MMLAEGSDISVEGKRNSGLETYLNIYDQYINLQLLRQQNSIRLQAMAVLDAILCRLDYRYSYNSQWSEDEEF
ncbi:hypothetical protein CS542_09480 [Pedobacter sp. IW39]|nr:hypothetical protein CS542_09480 [Pedobacter sp. IW39]